MRIENFKQLKVGDSVRVEFLNEYSPECKPNRETIEHVGRITSHQVDHITVDGWMRVTPSQVIARIVKRKKPKLEFVGYGIKLGNAKFVRVSELLMPEDTHEVWVRPIKKNKGDKND